MTIVYPAYMAFPEKNARSIQIMKTAHALANAGLEVRLLVAGIGIKPLAELLKYYDLCDSRNLSLSNVCLWPLRPRARFRFTWSFLFYYPVLRAILSMARRRQADFIYLRDQRLCLKLLRRKKQLNIPVVLELHYAGCYYDLLSPSHDKSRRGKQEKIYRKERTLLTEVSGLVMTTRSLREIVEKEFPLKCPVRVIPNGTDPPQSFRRYDFSDKKDIYYIGSLDREKGVDVALQAMKFLPESKLVIIGEGRKRAHEWLNDLARRERIESRVEFKGYLEPGKIKGIMGSARILVLPYPDTPLNRYCTSPLKLFESLASGSPIVASSLPTTREILAHEKNAYLVQPGDPRALAQGIRVLYDNPELSREIARNARSEAEKYTWDQRAGNINDFLSSVDRNNKFPPQSQRPSSRFYG